MQLAAMERKSKTRQPATRPVKYLILNNHPSIYLMQQRLECIPLQATRPDDPALQRWRDIHEVLVRKAGLRNSTLRFHEFNYKINREDYAEPPDEALIYLAARIIARVRVRQHPIEMTDLLDPFYRDVVVAYEKDSTLSGLDNTPRRSTPSSGWSRELRRQETRRIFIEVVKRLDVQATDDLKAIIAERRGDSKWSSCAIPESEYRKYTGHRDTA